MRWLQVASDVALRVKGVAALTPDWWITGSRNIMAAAADGLRWCGHCPGTGGDGGEDWRCEKAPHLVAAEQGGGTHADGHLFARGHDLATRPPHPDPGVTCTRFACPGPPPAGNVVHAHRLRGR